ncbi:hypothetical protein FD754_009828 [Muntiacus muntjak]|uniref:Mitochondrial fission factor n=1 Tax=Muntiacus muntjak TaxID=9888 RepID=A0A5N3WUY9_MUNMU|nr:hypothetical protein FD754_009828 [Muntiacus muntjak]
MEYTKSLSEQTRSVEKLKVTLPNADLKQRFQGGVSNASVMLQVPDRPLALKTPPCVLRLTERPLDFLDLERPFPTPPNKKKSIENAVGQDKNTEGAKRELIMYSFTVAFWLLNS